MLEAVLPKSFSYIVLRSSISSKEKFQCDIRAKIGSLEDFSSWLDDFENITNTCWRVRDSVSSEKSRFQLSKKYVCQHSAYRKKEDKSKNKNCLATLHVRIKRNTKFIRCRDALAKDGYRTIIRIDFNHSHNLNEPNAWKWLPKSHETKEIFLDLFDCGLSPAAAISYHRSLLMAKCPEFVSNGRLNPPTQWVHNLYQKWQKKNPGNVKTKKKRLIVTQSDVLENESSQFTALIEDDECPTIIECETDTDTLFDTGVCFSSNENLRLERILEQNLPNRKRTYLDSDLHTETRTDEELYSTERTSNEIFGELVACYLDKLSTFEKQSNTRIKITKMLLDELIIDN